jgi:hypothetical protein
MVVEVEHKKSIVKEDAKRDHESEVQMSGKSAADPNSGSYASSSFRMFLG